MLKTEANMGSVHRQL